MLILFSLTLLCAHFIFAYPAVCSFDFRLPCCMLILFSLTLLSAHFIFAYPAVPLFYFRLPASLQPQSFGIWNYAFRISKKWVLLKPGARLKVQYFLADRLHPHRYSKSTKVAV